MNDTWRFIDTGLCSAAYNMALDEAIAFAVRRDNAPPTLRLYGWDVPSVSIGCFQKVRDVDIDYCIEKHIPIVRRLTGGRAVLHNHEITYSFSAKTTNGLFSKGLLDSYRKVSRAFVIALSTLGLTPELKLQRESNHRNPLCFQSISYGEVTIKNRKVIGSAQKRWPDGFLQQGSVPCSIDKDEIARVFRLESSEAGEKIIGLEEILLNFNLKDLKNAIKVSFEETFDTQLITSTLSHEEVSLAEELKFQKYISPHWNFRR